MIIHLVAVGNALLSQLFAEFTVGVDESRAALRQGVVLKDICHVMEQPRHRKEHLRRYRGILPLEKALRIAVPSRYLYKIYPWEYFKVGNGLGDFLAYFI